MNVDDFFKGVSDALAANRNNAGLFFTVIVFIILAVFLYFKYFYGQTNKNKDEETIKSDRGKTSLSSTSTANLLIENIFSGETSHEAISLKNLINYYIDRYIENSLDALTINALNNKYWELISYIINKKFKTTNNDNNDSLFELTFTEDEKKIINFAYLSNRLILSSGSFNENSLDNAFASDYFIKEYDIKFYTITSWLTESLKEFTSTGALERLDQELFNINAKISMAGLEKEISLKTRKLLLYEIAKQNAEKPLVKALLATSEKIDRIIDAYSFYKYKTASGFSMSKNELLEFVNIENFLINSLRNERREELKNIAYGERYNNELISLETEIINKEYELLHLVSMKARCITEIKKYIDCQKNTSAETNIEFLNLKIEYLKNTLASVAKRNEIEPILFMTKKIYPKIPDIIYQIITKFIEADPAVFKSRLTKNAGLPFILFVPGCGNGIYNAETNTLIMPEFPIKDYNELVISALALYRWESDDEGNLKRSFHSLKCNKRLSFTSLQQSFIKDYILYITKEKEGGSSLDKEITDWFKFEISPKKGEEIKIRPTARITYKEENTETNNNYTKKDAKLETLNNTGIIDNADNINNTEDINTGININNTDNANNTNSTGNTDDINKIDNININPADKVPVLDENTLKKPLIYDKLKLLFKNKELINNKLNINFIENSSNFNIELKNISTDDFNEFIKLIYDNPKIKDYLTGLLK